LTRFKLQILELAKKQCQFIANYNKIEEIVIAHLAELSVSQASLWPQPVDFLELEYFVTI